MPDTQASQTPHLSDRMTLAGGLYEVSQKLRDTAFGSVFQATDSSTGTPMTVHRLRDDLAQNGRLVDALQNAVATASQVSHKNVASVVGVINEGPQVFLLSEFLEGHLLRELVARKQQEGSTFSAKQVSNIVAHLCAAAEACGQIGGHGALTVDSVLVNKAGRVRVVDIGLGIAAPACVQQLGARLAPEVHQGAAPSSAADVYGIGAIAYELLVGTPPQAGCKRPSEVIPGLSPLVDQFVAATMSGDPSQRPPLNAVAQAAQKALAAAGPAPTAQTAAVKPARPSLAQAITQPEPQAQAQAAPAANHSAALSQALTETHERWLITKGKLDYGPFPLSTIVKMIESDEILPGNLLVDNETGTRVKIENHPLLADLVDAAKQRRDDERRANAEVAHAKQERSRGAMLYVIIALAVAGLGGGAYATVKALSSDDGEDEAKLATLDEGSFEAKITFPSQEEAQKRRKKHRGKGGGGGKGDAWDESLNLDMEGAGGGGGERLTNGEVNSEIQKHGGKLGRCLQKTKSSDAFIEFMVKGSTGKVYQVRVNGSTSSPLYKCVRGAMGAMSFRTFNGIRSKHNFDLSF